MIIDDIKGFLTLPKHNKVFKHSFISKIICLSCLKYE